MRMRTNIVAVESLTPRDLTKMLRGGRGVRVHGYSLGSGERKIATIQKQTVSFGHSEGSHSRPTITVKGLLGSSHFPDVRAAIDFLNCQT